jgi:uncharacterized membrane protein
MEYLSGASLLTATITMGLTAGVFGLYAHTIMPGLRRTDDRTFVAAFQAIDKAIINSWFMVSFFGALVLTGVAGALHLASDRRPVLPWTLAAFVLYLATVVITLAVNVPLNNALKGAGDPNRIADPAAVRRRFKRTQMGRLEPRAHLDVDGGVRLPRLGPRPVRNPTMINSGSSRPWPMSRTTTPELSRTASGS